MATIGTRGKWAEGRVKAFLKSLESAGTTHHRFPDMRAGSMVTAPCDFMVIRNKVLTLIEVKEVNHKFRLPHGNFSVDQVARMRMWNSAGAEAKVLIYFTPLTEWRCIDISMFITRTGGSWDLSDWPLVPERTALAQAVGL